MNQEQNELDSFGEIEDFTPINTLSNEELEEISIIFNEIDEFNQE